MGKQRHQLHIQHLCQCIQGCKRWGNLTIFYARYHSRRNTRYAPASSFKVSDFACRNCLRARPICALTSRSSNFQVSFYYPALSVAKYISTAPKASDTSFHAPSLTNCIGKFDDVRRGVEVTGDILHSTHGQMSRSRHNILKIGTSSFLYPPILNME